MKAICSGMFMALLLVGNAFAQDSKTPSAYAHDCKKIGNPTKRLACFDNQQKVKELLAEDEKIRKAAEENQKRKADEEQKKEAEFVSAARACLSAIKKLEARVSVGISYRDYYAPLADTKFEVESFVRGANGDYDYNQEFAKHISKALSHYQMAGSVWIWKFESLPVNKIMPISRELLSLYPQAAAHTTESMFGDSKMIEYDRILSIIWAEAKYETDKAEMVLTTPIVRSRIKPTHHITPPNLSQLITPQNLIISPKLPQLVIPLPQNLR